MVIELRSESVVQIEKSSGTEEIPNVPNDDTSTSTEVLQIVEQDHEEVEEEPQVYFISTTRSIFLGKRFLFVFSFKFISINTYRR